MCYSVRLQDNTSLPMNITRNDCGLASPPYFPTYRFLIEVDRIEFKWVFIEPSNHNPSLVYTIVHTASDVAEYLAITSDSHTAAAPGLCLVPFRFGVVFGFISNTPSDRAIAAKLHKCIIGRSFVSRVSPQVIFPISAANGVDIAFNSYYIVRNPIDDHVPIHVS